jgi:hypothetical protein
MTWLLTRQHRTFLVVTAVGLAVFAIAVAVTGIQMAQLYADARDCRGAGCLGTGHLFSGYGAIIDTVHLTIVVPVLLAAFAATIVARETEARTNVLVWTQSVTRRRWVAAKFGAALTVAVVIGAALSGLVTWWSSTTNSLNGDRFQGAQFDTQNLVPVALAGFGVALGLAAGSLFRRVLPAVATTVGVYVGVRMANSYFLRPRLGPTSRLRVAVDADPKLPSGSWTTTRRLVDAAGHTVTGVRAPMPKGCDITRSAAAGARCLTEAGYREVVAFHPASQYWTFQLLESALFVLLAAGLVLFAARRLLRRDA